MEIKDRKLDVQKSEKPARKKKTPKRNNQNSFRTLLRSIKQIIKMNYHVKIPKFYECCDCRYLLAILRKENQFGRLKQIQEFLENEFYDIIKTKRVRISKDIKMKSILLKILSMNEENFK